MRVFLTWWGLRAFDCAEKGRNRGRRVRFRSAFAVDFPAFASHMIQVMDGARRLVYRAPITKNPMENAP